MKAPMSLRVRLLILVIVALAGVSIATLRPSRSGAEVSGGKPGANKEQFHALLRRGIGTEVLLATEGASSEQTRASVDSVSRFIAGRSGLKLREDVKDRLAAMEERVLNGLSRRITVDQLSDIILQTMVERVRRTTDDEIAEAVRIMSGSVSAGPDRQSTPDRTQMRLRGDGRGLAAETFTSSARLVREMTGSPSVLLPLATRARGFVGQEVWRRVSSLTEALPDRWGRVAADGLTPAQAFIAVYSLASDDYLWYSKYELLGIMKSIESSGKKRNPSYPASDGRFAYGTSGYLFPSPLDLLLDKGTVDALLDHTGERSTK
jgi:hypothetical protein